jgi:ADP-ribose pyrophosphatase YjhB (NUDIX family)
MNITSDSIPRWLEWARQIQSLAQTGLAFASNDYEVERNKRLIELAAEITSEHTDQTLPELATVLMNQPGYATPKVDVRTAVIRDNKILLVKEAADNCWAMPGGWADVGDTPSEVAVRETKEESGYDVKVKKIVGVFDANRGGRPLEFFHAFKIIFLCELTGGKAQTSSETLAVDFHPLDKLPRLSRNRTDMKHINEIIEHIKDPARHSYFD